ncbi:unnamed protein product [Soboliphyme baturini]|uniref:Uncharacterized protein n=1 Tax=Soboliphyme baturini TaxID=241478 RepID=A0A183IQW3_9BILA|nr:unnamed protein product [Soboliphyme baturini]
MQNTLSLRAEMNQEKNEYLQHQTASSKAASRHLIRAINQNYRQEREFWQKAEIRKISKGARKVTAQKHAKNDDSCFFSKEPTPSFTRTLVVSRWQIRRNASKEWLTIFTTYSTAVLEIRHF